MKVVGFMVCGPNEKYLRRTLDEFKRLCDDAVIATNNADDETKKTIKEYGYWQYEDNREWGVHQPNIKTDLLTRIGKLSPDVIIPLDADERFDSSYTRELVEKYSKEYPACYFYIVNHWNDEQHHRRSMGFWNIRQFNYLPQYGLQYQRKNLHCGLGPPWAYHYGSHVPHFIHHYGLMASSDRKRKVERYEKYDPSAKWKDRAYYEALKAETTGSEFNEKEWLKRLEEEVAGMGKQKKNMATLAPIEYVYVRRLSDGQVLDIPKSQLDETLKRGFELVEEIKIAEPAPVKEEVKVVDGFTCVLCGEKKKTEKLLQKHRETKHK